MQDKIYGYRFKKNITTQGLKMEVSDKFIRRWKFEEDTTNDSDSARLIDFSTDKFGFRVKSDKPVYSKESLRIFCCGGSTTSCDGVDNSSTWPSVLEDELISSGFNVQVTNAGVPGWHSYQDLLLIKNEIVKFKPDIILLHQGWNEEFEYSSLNLGKWWKKQTVRNDLESNFLYIPKSKFLSQRLSMFMLFAVRAISWNLIFKKRMSFSNINRWKSLLSKNYLESWFYNILEIANLCKDNNIMLFTLDYPALVDVRDTDSERQYFLRHPIFAERLSPDFADYQAISKLGISYFLKDISDLVPNLNASEYVNRMNYETRAMQFGDEIHFSSLGCKNFGSEHARLISVNPDFVLRNNREFRDTNVLKESYSQKVILEKVVGSREFIRRLIKKKIMKIESVNSNHTTTVHSERYTTF
jgi:hypothetical protein